MNAPVEVAPVHPASAAQTRSVRDRLALLFPEATRPAARTPAAPGPAAPESAPQPGTALRPVTPGKIVLAVTAVLVGAGISLGRISGPGPFNSIFAEDGNNFLTDALNLDPYHAIRRPVNGYFHLGPRLLAEVAALFPVAWGPAVLSIEAALVTALMALAVYVASGTAFSRVPVRLLVSVPMVAMPLAENPAATTTNSVATLQFLGVYTLFWMLLWAPASRSGRITAVLAVGLIAASTLLGAVFLPLALLRLYLRRGLVELLMVGGLALGTALHLTALALGRTARPAFMVPRLDPGWGLGVYSRWALPNELFGYRWLGPPASLASWRVPAVLAWLIVVAAVVLAWRRISRPDWGLAVLAGGFSVGLLLFQVMSSGVTEERYVIAPGMLMVTAMAALLRPGRRWYAIAPFAAYAALVAVVVLVNYRGTDSGRSTGPAWDDRLRPAVAACNANPSLRVIRVPTAPPAWGDHWYVDVPCHRVRQ